MAEMISIIIPNRNGEATIGKCLEAAFASRFEPFEVIVVDDCSGDRSVDIIKRFPCRLIQLERHSGAARARNVGAQESRGDILFFTDADCLMQEDTLSAVARAFAEEGPGAVVGGSYTRIPHDKGFFSIFQSVFINYSETKRPENPDYIATHAMAIDAGLFRRQGGFDERFLPILEDVEFSHRLRKAGVRFVMRPEVLVQHIFNFSMLRSLRNALRKSTYWTVYSLGHRDVLADSGTAGAALKTNVAAFFLSAFIAGAALAAGEAGLLWLILAPLGANLAASGGLLRAFGSAGGWMFGLLAGAYYMGVYPLAVGLGAVAGTVKYFGQLKKYRSLPPDHPSPPLDLSPPPSPSPLKGEGFGFGDR
ncbi:MAG: glycosyltransferase family 2 protein [Nitrospirota bacterium]